MKVIASGNSTSTADLTFEICDTGIGISSDTQSELFAPFRQADSSTTRKFGGSGLGLSICKSLVEAMGGTIGVRSILGVGSTFTFYLPLPVATANTQSSPIQLPKLHILIVIPHGKTRAMLVRDLTSAGCQVTQAESADEGIEIYHRARLTESRPAVVLLERSGALRDGHWPAIIMIRSRFEVNRPIDGNLVDRIVSKPLKSAAVLDAVQALLQPENSVSQRPEITLPAVSALAGIRVMVADDNIVNQKVAARLLEQMAARVTCVGNGRAALASLRDEDFDVVLMDCQMPEMDGYEATRQFRRSEGSYRNPKTPIIALTAHVMASDREKCLSAGMYGYLSKPIDKHRLQTAITDALNRFGGRLNTPD